MTKHQDWWAIDLNFTRANHSSDMRLVGQKPPYLLNLTVGDPDAGTAMQFEEAVRPM